jgi:AmmeMemoRadiSam system protein B
MIRHPVVAGRFYPADPAELTSSLDFCLNGPAAQSSIDRALACMVPHAGYPFSGQVAGTVYRSLEPPSRVILIGPRHFPAGQPLAILSEGEWLTPLGPARIDTALATKLKRACPLLREDAVAHQREHALEVQLPFLQRVAKDFTFVPMALGTIVLAALEELGEAIARVVASEQEPVLLVASSDMNHYESDSLTRPKDRMAIEKILELDPRGLFETVRAHDISMCGFAAAVTMLFAARTLGATTAELLSYATSGDVTGDREAVVGYAGIIVR